MRKKASNKLFVYLWRIIAALLTLSIGFVLLFRFVPVYVTPLMLIRSVQQLSEGKKIQLEHHWVSIDKISRNLSLAVICSEDQNFLNHFGFDVKAIEELVKTALNSQNRTKRLRGASTISQQTAKNVFLWPQRSWVRKGLEVYFTFLIEIAWSKKRILEVYLNSIEMGNGVYGAEAASRHYYNKSAKDLSKRQAAAIAAILPNPREYRANPPSSYIRSRIDWIMGQMNRFGELTL